MMKIPYVTCQSNQCNSNLLPSQPNDYQNDGAFYIPKSPKKAASVSFFDIIQRAPHYSNHTMVRSYWGMMW